jgi:hypothetical protein
MAGIFYWRKNETAERHLVCQNIRPVDYRWHAAGGYSGRNKKQ